MTYMPTKDSQNSKSIRSSRPQREPNISGQDVAQNWLKMDVSLHGGKAGTTLLPSTSRKSAVSNDDGVDPLESFYADNSFQSPRLRNEDSSSSLQSRISRIRSSSIAKPNIKDIENNCNDKPSRMSANLALRNSNSVRPSLSKSSSFLSDTDANPTIESPPIATSDTVSAISPTIKSTRTKPASKLLSTVATMHLCATCRQPINSGGALLAGKYYHNEHFACSGTDCGHISLKGHICFDRNNQLYCEPCHTKAFCHPCAYCSQPIKKSVIEALGKHFHPEHFFCSHCGKELGNAKFHEYDGKPYCVQDYLDLFSGRCSICHKALDATYIKALNKSYHANCFTCTVRLQIT